MGACLGGKAKAGRSSSSSGEKRNGVSQPLQNKPWYFGEFSKVQAEQHLGQCSDDGTFLIRPSQSVPGEYSISVRDKDLVKHYRIQQREDPPYKYFLSQQAYFDTVAELVEFYQHNTGTGGLRLTDPAPLNFHTDV